MKHLWFIIDENKSILTVSIDEYAKWMAKPFSETRRVAEDRIGDLRISTVFLGIDHRLASNDNGENPILFETMVFDKEGADIEMERYCTWDEAVKGHKGIVERVTSWNSKTQK